MGYVLIILKYCRLLGKLKRKSLQKGEEKGVQLEISN